MTRHRMASPPEHSPATENTPPSSPERASQGQVPEPSLVQSAEGRILRWGLILSVVYLLGLAVSVLLDPRTTPTLGAMTALNVLVGRAAGMTWGYANGLPHSLVIPANALIETIQVLTIYPLFVLSWRHLVEIRALKSFLARTQRVAEARRGTIRRYGLLGLFVFVFTPFWMTGPVVGSVVGFLIGLRPWANMTIVLSATYVAIGTWALLLHGLSDWAAAYNQYAPFGLVAALVILFGFGHLLRGRMPRP